MKAKLSIITLILSIMLTFTIATAQYPSVVDITSSSPGVGPHTNPDGSYTFIVESPSGTFSSVTLNLNGNSYPMAYENTRWIVVVSNVSAGSMYHYQIVTASGVIFDSGKQKI